MSSKIALITGANRGLGRSMALHLARRGVGIVGTFNSHPDEAHAAAAEIEAEGGIATMLQLDVGKSEAFPAFAATVLQTLQARFDRSDFDYLVNNAGNSAYAPVTKTTEEQFDQLVRVQFKAPLFLTQALLPMIIDGGRILNVSSAVTQKVTPGLGVYGAMKGAVEVLTLYLAKELGERQIRVNVIAPGAIATDFAGGGVRDNPDINKAVAGMAALRRVGLPDDIGGAVTAILSDDFGWATGARIEVSGGHSL
jgi:NAD(P)-dependent dehydrogenase (short-subunit alcohol dehydrogenase family)